MIKKLLGFVRLARPANLPTAAADILAGMAIGLFSYTNNLNVFFTENWASVLALLFSSVFLYAGGVVFNDVFDAELDAVERPERAIPSGLVPKKEATIWGVILVLFGIFLAFYVSLVTGYISLGLTVAILAYDGYFKHNSFLGPLTMGICRGINLVLGMSIIGNLENWWLSIVPILYIFAITLISRGEVHGNNKRHIVWAGFLYIVVMALIALFITIITDNFFVVLPFLLLFGFLILGPLVKAYQVNSPARIKKSVIAGVLSLIVMNACWVAGFSNGYMALFVLAFLPLSLLLSKLFSVT